MLRKNSLTKKIIFSGFLTLGIIIPLAFGLAENTLDSTNTTSTENNQNNSKNQSWEKRMKENEERIQQKSEELQAKFPEFQEEFKNKIKDRAKVAVEKRLQSMEQFNDNLKNKELVTEKMKGDINNNLDKASRGLGALLSDINAEEDAEKVKELAQGIIWDYRIYLVELPKNRGLAVVSAAGNTVNKISQSLEKLEDSIVTAEKTGMSIEDIKKDIAEVKNQIIALQPKIDSAEVEFLAMKPAKDITDARNHLEKGIKLLKEVRAEAQKIKTQLQSLVPELKKLINSSGNENKNSVQ